MPNESIQERAHNLISDLLIAAAAQQDWAEDHLDVSPEIWVDEPGEDFSRNHPVIIVRRPRVVGDEFISNLQSTIQLSISFMAVVPAKNDPVGIRQARNRAELLRDRAIAAIESQQACGLISIGALSWQHTWSREEEPLMNRSMMLAVEFELRVNLHRRRAAVAAPAMVSGLPVFPDPVSGYSGVSGRSGFCGYSGLNGTNGVDGASGYSGTAGSNGANGTNGASGYSGTAGTNGTNGASGTSGYSGVPHQHSVITDNSASRTLAPTDANAIIRMGASGAVVYVPGNLSSGFVATAIQDGSGRLGWSGVSGMTIRSFGGLLTQAGQYSTATVVVVASGECRLAGQLG